MLSRQQCVCLRGSWPVRVCTRDARRGMRAAVDWLERWPRMVCSEASLGRSCTWQRHLRRSCGKRQHCNRECQERLGRGRCRCVFAGDSGRCDGAGGSSVWMPADGGCACLRRKRRRHFLSLAKRASAVRNRDGNVPRRCCRPQFPLSRSTIHQRVVQGRINKKC